MPLAPGTRLGPYEIAAPLGAGGMGEVYRARDTRLGREVAVKVLPAEVAGDAERLRRFEQEARAVSALNHPHIVTLHEVGQSEHGPYLVLEKVEGKSLRELLRDGALPVKRVLQLGAQIAEGLAKAHSAGIVHRDLKPENVMVSDDGFAKILDFGLAKLIFPELESGQAAEMTTLVDKTASGMILGTLGYLSPEQAAGRPADFRSDQFALGALLYELATGERPFRRETTPESLAAVIREDPESIRSKNATLPAQLGWIVERCLAKDSDDRYASTRDLARDLADLRDHLSELGLLRNSPAAASSSPAGRRWAWPATAAVAAVAALAAGFWIATALSGPAADDPSSGWLSVEPLTQLPGVEGEPTISPDGNSVVYVRDGHLWLLRVGGSNAIDLTPDGNAAFAPAFSPDGQSIAFNSERDGGGIFVMGATGENVRRVTSRGFRPAWTPDGKEIVFSSTSAANSWGGVPRPGLDAVDLASGEVRRLCDCIAIAPTVSPHGHRIAFLSMFIEGRAQRDLRTVPLAGLRAGESPRAITDDAVSEWDPQWADGGDAIEFVSLRGGTPNLWRLPVDEATGEPRGEPTPRSLPAAWVDSVRATPDGATRVFVNYSRRSVFSRAELALDRGVVDGEPREVLRLGTAVFGPYDAGWFSPDGRTLAVLSGPAGPSLDEISLLALDGSSIRQLVRGPFRARAPSWSPDGRTIAFQADRGEKYEIWGIETDGGNLRLLATGSNQLFSPVWSPDGSHLLAVEVGGPVNRPVVHRMEDPTDRIEPFPALPDGGQFQAWLWSGGGDTILGTDERGSLWRWSLPERAYRRLPSSFATPADSILWIAAELPDGRIVLALERLAAGMSETGTDDIGRPRLGVDLVLFDPRTGAQQDLLTVPGSFRPGIALDRNQKSLWIHRWEEDSDLWIARRERARR